MGRLRWFGSVLFILVAPLVYGASELEDRAVMDGRVAKLFMAEQFVELDRMAADYWKKESRTESGLWMLTLFYAAIGNVASLRVKDEDYWRDIEGKSRRWIERYPKSPTAHIAHALILIGHGWKFRGGGWTRQVREEDWKPFHAYLQQAETYLRANKAVAALDPRWYEAMLEIATAEGWEIDRFNSLVDEATSRHPYFYQIYFTALNYLLPKWHGNKEYVETFARYAVEKTKDKEGMGMYARVYWVALQSQYDRRLFSDSAVVWNSMKQGINDVLAQYPDQWNINNFAYFACLAGDAAKTHELITRVKGEPISRVWGSGDAFQRCKAWSATSI